MAADGERRKGARTGHGGFWYRLVVVVLKPLLYAFTRRDWRGGNRVPREGGVLIVANHASVIDPVTLAHFLHDSSRRYARFLAKAELFKVPFVGMVLRRTGQIPVYRRTRDAAAALRDGVASLQAGECVVIYPEGTCTRDPAGWPMVAKTGVARLALTAGVPVIPLAHWGARDILPYRSKVPRLLPPHRIHVLVGEPVDLSAYAGREQDNALLKEVTDLLMRRVTELLGEIRGEEPPARPYDPAAARAAKATAAPGEGATP